MSKGDRDVAVALATRRYPRALAAIIKVADRPEGGDDDIERLTKTFATSCIDALGSRRQQRGSGYDQV